jgi:hypothetical protein
MRSSFAKINSSQRIFMDDHHFTSGEPSMTRFRRFLHRAFPIWFRWLLVAIVSSGFAEFGWSGVETLCSDAGEWVSTGRHGPHFNGGRGLVVLIFVSLIAIYSWWRVIAFIAAKANKRIQSIDKHQ